MKTLSTLILAVLVTSCAHTDFYRNGQRVAHFEGDMTKMQFLMSPAGDIQWAGDINHSSATTAQKAGAQGIVTAAGAAVAISGLTALLP